MNVEQEAAEEMIAEYRRHYRALKGKDAEERLFLCYIKPNFRMVLRLGPPNSPMYVHSWEQFAQKLNEIRRKRIAREDRDGISKPIDLRFRPRRSCLNCDSCRRGLLPANKAYCARDPTNERTEAEFAELLCDLWNERTDNNEKAG